MVENSEAPGGDYNAVPYDSRPFPQSQPARLAALARMFGLDPPDVARARVLELGCASGGNLIPLAVHFPDAGFHGIDLSQRHVDDGKRRIASLGLTNVLIEQDDLTTFKAGDARFDYIICHGVYSWVPPAARDAILRICADHLTEAGVAYISYNVLPGWQMRTVIRDMMLYHAGEIGAPQMRIAKARWVLDSIANAAPPGNPYGDMLRVEARTLAGMQDSYILGEFLAQDNAPCYFRDFNSRAEQAGLVYLCEAELNQCIPENISNEVGALIRVMSNDKLVPLEQYMDFFKGRTFRQSLLVRTAQSGRIQRRLLPERTRDLHVVGTMTCTASGDGASRFVFANPQKGSLTTGHADVRRALQAIADAFPASRSVAELLAAGDQPAILDAIFKAICVGLIDISMVAIPAARDDGDHPRASALARLDAADNSPLTTSRGHQDMVIDVVMRVLLPQLDGMHDRVALRRSLRRAVRDGALRLIDDKSGLDLAGAALDDAIAVHVDRAIGRLAAHGLLDEPAGPRSTSAG